MNAFQGTAGAAQSKSLPEDHENMDVASLPITWLCLTACEHTK